MRCFSINPRTRRAGSGWPRWRFVWVCHDATSQSSDRCNGRHSGVLGKCQIKLVGNGLKSSKLVSHLAALDNAHQTRRGGGLPSLNACCYCSGFHSKCSRYVRQMVKNGKSWYILLRGRRVVTTIYWTWIRIIVIYQTNNHAIFCDLLTNHFIPK